jgi:uncharacterized protein (DUF1778 family)
VKDTHTPLTSVRIPPDVKAAAQRRAAAEGRTLTDVVVAYLRRYGHKVTTPPPADAP